MIKWIIVTVKDISMFFSALTSVLLLKLMLFKFKILKHQVLGNTAPLNFVHIHKTTYGDSKISFVWQVKPL